MGSTTEGSSVVSGPISVDSKPPTRASMAGGLSHRATMSSAGSISTSIPITPPHHLILSPSFFRPTLLDLCVPILAHTFINHLTLAPFPPPLRSHIVSLLPLDLPLHLSAKHIPDEDYWRRKAQSLWRVCDISAHGRSWKQLFFERYVASSLESFDPTVEAEEDLEKLLQFSAPFVHNLEIGQLPSHLCASIIFEPLGSQLSSLKLEFGWRNARMEYDPSRFGMKISDCLSLSSSLCIAKTLTILDLSYNHLNDEKVTILVKGMLKSSTLIQLDLSHNYISNGGASELSKFLSSEKCALGGLNLGDNHILGDGAKPIGEALERNSTLLSLNLRYNRIGDEGGQAIFDALQMNTTLQRLGLGSCEVGKQTAYALGRLIGTSKSGIVFLDISANPLIGTDGGMYVQSSLMQETSKPPKHIDLQLCELGNQLEEDISKFIQRRNEVEVVQSLSETHPFKV